MPLELKHNGFLVTYSRGKTVVAGVVAFLFSMLMIGVGLDVYFSILDGTPFEHFDITRRPPWLWGGLAVFAGVMLAYFAIWHIRAGFGDAIAISVSEEGVLSNSILGRRKIAWTDVARVSKHKSTIFLHSSAPGGKDVPLQMFMTSVRPDELRSALAGFRPALFPTETEEFLP